MRIKLTDSVVVRGFPGVKKGDVIDVPDNIGSELISMHCAVFSDVAPKTEAIIETREPEIETRDPGFSTETASQVTKRKKRA